MKQIIGNDILTSVPDVVAHRLAYHEPVRMAQGVIYDLQTSLEATSQTETTLPIYLQKVAADYVDRR